MSPSNRKAFDVDLDAETLSIPAELMKNGRELADALGVRLRELDRVQIGALALEIPAERTPGLSYGLKNVRESQ